MQTTLLPHLPAAERPPDEPETRQAAASSDGKPLVRLPALRAFCETAERLLELFLPVEIRIGRRGVDTETTQAEVTLAVYAGRVLLIHVELTRGQAGETGRALLEVAR